MGILELPGVHMHWADRWRLRGSTKLSPLDFKDGMVVELKEGSTITVLEAPNVLPFDDVAVEPEPEPQPLTESRMSPWLTVPCGVCGRDIEFYLTVGLADFNPFNATVIVVQCEQCASRWAAILPPVVVTEADKLNLQEAEVIDGSTN